MKKTKLKLKKQVWVVLIIILFAGIGIYAGVNIKKDWEYKQTNEYKLLEIGYTKDEINLLDQHLPNERIDLLLNEEKNDFLIQLIQQQFYIKDYLERYESYYQNNQSLSPQMIVAIVNTWGDYTKYDNNIEANLDNDYLLLVNKYYFVDSDYSPSDLVEISNKYYYGSNHKIRKIVYDAFIDMWNAAYNENIYFIINSSYRTFEQQQNTYDFYKDNYGTTYADSIAARPGYSEHQTGLALDIFSKNYASADSFKNSTDYAWLQNNAYKYGFIERYPEGKENITGFNAEAWHWRYVGVEVATYIYENNITFDEYYAYFIENK